MQFLLGADGQPTAAIVEIGAWQAFVAMLEEVEDQGLLRAYLARRRMARSPEQMSLIFWQYAEATLDARSGE